MTSNASEPNEPRSVEQIMAGIRSVIAEIGRLEAKRLATVAEPTPSHKRGIHRAPPTDFTSQLVRRLEWLLIESINGRLCGVDDPTACMPCQRQWADVRDLIDRYDQGER